MLNKGASFGVEKAAPACHRLSAVCHRLSPGCFWVEKAARQGSLVTGMSPPGFEPRGARPGLATAPMDLLGKELGAFGWKSSPPSLSPLVTGTSPLTARFWVEKAARQAPLSPACHRRDSRRRKLGLPRFVSPRDTSYRNLPSSDCKARPAPRLLSKSEAGPKARPAPRLRSKGEAGSAASVQSDSRGCCEITARAIRIRTATQRVINS